MSTTGNSLNGIRKDLDWECKIVTATDMLWFHLAKDNMETILEYYRDWMLGGKFHEWRYSKLPSGSIRLERR